MRGVGRRPPKKSALFEIEKKKVSSYMHTRVACFFFLEGCQVQQQEKSPPKPFLLAAKAPLQGRKRGGANGAVHTEKPSLFLTPPIPEGV